MKPAAQTLRRKGAAQYWAATAMRFAAGILLGVLLWEAPAAHGQAFEISGGSSSLYGANGGTVQIYGENYTARASVGYFGHLRTGFSVLTKFHGYLMDAGDQSIPFSLPTDLVEHSYYFQGRGLSAKREIGKDHLYVYGGVTSTAFSTPFLSVASADSMAGLVFFDHEFTPTLHFYSYNILSRRQTSIQALDWAPRKNVRLALAGGLGSNQRYGAATASYEISWLKVLAGYVSAGRAFQRIRVDNPILSETDRENIRVEVSPRRWLHLNYDRENFVSPDEKGLFPRARVNGFGGFVNAAGFVLHGELYDSHTDTGNSRAIAGGVRRNIGNWLNLSEDYFRSVQAHGATTQSLVTSVREKITRRITLSQYVTTGNGQTTITYGGSFFSNRFSFGVDYQSIYLPLVSGAPSQFKQVLVANVRLLLPHSIELNAMTDVTPDGKLRYTGYFNTFLYRGLGASVPGAPAIGPGMYTYVVRGRVVDERGEPVRGAAVRVQGEIAFTNSEGEFEVRRKHAEEYPFAVALEEFMVAGRYEVVRAPGKVKAARDEVAAMEEVVVRRLPTLPRKSELSPAEIPAADNGALKAELDLPLTPRTLTLPEKYADVPLNAKIPYNRPGNGGNGGKQQVASGNSVSVQPGCGSAGPGATGAVRPAAGSGATGCATPANGWRVLDSSGPEVARSGRRESECFGLAKQLGACSGPRGKLRVQTGRGAAGGSAAHRAAKGARPQPAAAGRELPASSSRNATVPAAEVPSPARAASTK